MLHDSEFLMTKCAFKKSSEGGKRVISITFAYKGKEGLGKRLGGQYSFELDPTNSWRITSFEIKSKDDVVERVNIDYSNSNDNFAFPSKATSKTVMPSKRFVYEEECIVSKPLSKVWDSSEFFLPYYGIPETVLGPKAANNRNRYLLFGIGSILLIAAIVVLWKYRNPSAKPTTIIS